MPCRHSGMGVTRSTVLKSVPPLCCSGTPVAFATSPQAKRPLFVPSASYLPAFGVLPGIRHPLATAASANPGRFGRCRLPASQAAARAKFTATPVNSARRWFFALPA
jgi:hypothetical protein